MINLNLNQKYTRNFILLSVLVIMWKQISSVSIEVPNPDFETDQLKLTFVRSPELPYSQAEAVCSNVYNGHLAKFNTEREEDILLDLTVPHSIGQHYWIGLHWTPNGTGNALVWNDGNCTSVDPRDNYNKPASKNYQSSKLCYMNRGDTDLQWESHNCASSKPFLCQTTQDVMTPVGMTLHVIHQYDSDQETCQELCKRLKDCFITSNITNGCIVGLASSTAGTFVLETMPDDLTTVDEGDNYYMNVTNGTASNAEPICRVTAESRNQTKMSLNDYQVRNGLSLSCPSSSPVVITSSVYLTETLVSTRQARPCTPTPVLQTVVVTVTEAATIVVQSTHIDTTTVVQRVAATVKAGQLQVSGADSAYTSTATVAVSTDELVKELTVDRTSLSRTVRAKTSASNHVVSAIVVGTGFTFFGAGVISLIVFSDLFKIIIDIKMRMFHNLRGCC